ncbi:DUF3987 domain-containing protein [Prolixibacteraceae bacterium JC049]|nr:DUF3987 domain-containing protein [Prolixibacteraceae bacterium JC049]
MKKKTFNPLEWLEQPNQQLNKSIDVSRNVSDSSSLSVPSRPDSVSSFESKNSNDVEAPVLSDVETVIQQIETRRVDITSTYPAWLTIGFAFVDEFGESGRNYYHRVSCFHTDYSENECNKQFDKCLRSKGHGIRINTFFHLAREAGISISFPRKNIIHQNLSASSRPDSVSKSNDEIPALSSVEVIFNTPQIPSEIYNQLPEILKESIDLFEDPIEKDVFLIGAITVISACLPNIEGIYFDEPVSAHLYSFITAPAGSGKGKLKWAKYFGIRIHKSIVEQSIREHEAYEKAMEEYNSLNKNQRQGVEKPKEPKRLMFFIPANSSSSAFIQALADNGFKGIIFETEADTLAGTLKQDWGNFSDVLRKAFHHESTNMFRRKDNEHIEVEDPHLAIALSGTPKQVHNMMPDTENGLFSRFLYYAFEDYSDFKNPFLSHRKVNYTEFFDQKGHQIKELHQILKSELNPVRFEFTPEQAEIFTNEFRILCNRNRTLLGNDFQANSRRLGLITFRIAMVLSALRILEEGAISSPLLCNEVDFQTAIQIAFTLEKHAIAVFQNLPNNNLKGVKLKFYNALPANFNRQGYLSVAKEFEIKEKTAEKYIGQFKESGLLDHEHNNYTKTEKRT